MRAKGIAYDTGLVSNGETSRKSLDPAVVRRELAIIRDDLHCNAVQIVGGDPERLELAATVAAELGMEVWFSPYPLQLTDDEMLSLFTDCARRAESLRKAGAEVVFVTGVELTIMNHGFLPGDSVYERLGRLLDHVDGRGERLAEASARLDAFLGKAVAAVREHFQGRVTYAAIPFERIDWTRFDIMSVELIRSAEVADRYRDGVRALVAQGKPVAITGFGASTYRGAADAGARGMEIAEYENGTLTPVRLKGDYVRDEEGQATYLREVLEVLETEGVDAAFVYLFALENHPHRPDGDPRDDLDLASPSIVKFFEDRYGQTYPDMRWEPKAAFTALAEIYRT
jgi:hypothetical protein